MATSLLIGKAVIPSAIWIPFPPGMRLPSWQPTTKTDIQPRRSSVKCFVSRVPGLGVQPLRLNQKRPVIHSSSARSASLICAAALSARASGETQTIQQETTKLTNAPLDNKEKSPDLDDGGAGFPPRDDDGGGGGGGGGGWQGGFFFFGFLAFLGFMKDNEGEGSGSKKRRRKLNKM